MPAFKNIKDLCARIQIDVNTILLEEVTDEVAEVERKHVYDDVYSRATSGDYQRRYDGGGLGSVENMHGELIADGILEVINETPYNPYKNGINEDKGISRNAGRGPDLAGLVNYGDGWNGVHYDWAPCGTTNFVENTQEELRDGRVVVAALKKGLRREGYYVE